MPKIKTFWKKTFSATVYDDTLLFKGPQTSRTAVNWPFGGFRCGKSPEKY